MIYRKLLVYKLAKSLTVDVYKLTQYMPKYERYGIISQITRSAISIPSNIAEGSGRKSLKEQIYFIEVAYGSLMELSCQLEIALELNYISEQQYDEINKRIHNLAIRLYNYKEYKQKSIASQ
ncbi:four helix bundle protein [Sedimentibacter sp.]|uniref:four helix bundle protein n=1 Tax=Sedimentibacter sp. TaxID=1960295 RepID=UPI0028ADA824|nr:four helix bundle protein [Sedimentibacter sp.]